MKQIIYLLRPHHYIKNLFIFAPLLFSFNFQWASFLNAVEAFILFSLLASSVYVLNDVMDVEEDKKHPVKKNRPIAAGNISKSKALIAFIALAVFSLTASYFVDKALFFVLAIYFFLNVFYSIKLKHFALIDILIIAVGFVLRLYAGSAATDVELSVWIITITFLLALFIALAKRRDDLVLGGDIDNIRKSIDGYNLEFINVAMTMMGGVVIVSYILYTISDEVISRMNTPYLFLTTLFVIMGIMRYLQITFVEEKSGSPVGIVLTDMFLKVTILLWIASFLLLVFY